MRAPNFCLPILCSLRHIPSCVSDRTRQTPCSVVQLVLPPLLELNWCDLNTAGSLSHAFNLSRRRVHRSGLAASTADAVDRAPSVRLFG